MTPLRHSLAICEDYLAAVSGKDDGALAIVRAELRVNGWLFYYQSQAFLESGNWQDALGGNQPILVTNDGEVEVVSLGQSVDEVAGPSGSMPFSAPAALRYIARDLDRQRSAEPQSAGDLVFEDLDQPVKDSRAVPRSRSIQVGLDVRPVQRMAGSQPALQLANGLWVTEPGSRQLMLSSLNEVVITGEGGEVWCTPDHYGTFWPWAW